MIKLTSVIQETLFVIRDPEENKYLLLFGNVHDKSGKKVSEGRTIRAILKPIPLTTPVYRVPLEGERIKTTRLLQAAGHSY